MKEFIIYAPQGMLGYGYPIESFERAISFRPHMIGVDAGSTDAGPFRLGSGKPTTGKIAVKRDLRLPLVYAIKNKIPLIIGSAGGAGAKEHVEWTAEIILEIAKEENLHGKIAIIYSDIDKEWLNKKLSLGFVKPLGPVNSLSKQDIDEAIRIVGVMGIEPYITAIEEGANVILAGRSNDPAIFASYLIANDIPYEVAFHAGKILECGAIAAVPGTASDGMIAIVNEKSLILEPSNERRRCTVLSVSAHSLYEKEHPYLLIGPEGTLNLVDAVYTQLDERRVEIKGQRFEEANETWIKIEGAKYVGKRCIVIGIVRDPIMITQEEEWKEALINEVENYFKGENFRLLIKTWGEKEKTVIIEAIAKNEELSRTVVSWARSYLMHYHYKGRIATSGNLALPYSPSEINMGDVYEFNIHHLVKINGDSPFTLEFLEF